MAFTPLGATVLSSLGPDASRKELLLNAINNSDNMWAFPTSYEDLDALMAYMDDCIIENNGIEYYWSVSVFSR